MFLDYSRKFKVIGHYDIIVCGGGSAGFAAAVQAGRLGLKVALVEKYGALGGVITTGGNNDIALFYAEGKHIIAGVGWEFVNRLAKQGFAHIPDFENERRHWVLGVNVNVPMAARLMDVMCEEAGVDLYLSQQIIDVVTTENEGVKKVEGIVLASKNGPEVLTAKNFIDCTGDGDVCAMGGAEYELGDPETKALQPGTLRFYPKGYQMSDLDKDQIYEVYKTATEKGEITREDYWSGNPYVIFANNGNNINHIEVNAVDSKSRTEAEIEGRKSIERIVTWARKHVKGAERFEATAFGHEIAIRETRRIIGEAYITVEDYLTAKHYEDAVCYSYYPIDLHTKGDKTLENIYLDSGKVPMIPLGALTAKGFSNLMMAGRCISGDRLANSAFRVKASCMAMGQAAAVASVISVKENLSIQSVDCKDVLAVLKKEGAIIPE